ncbi:MULTISPECIES: caspase family protein [Sinorhizobium]|uniref:caspase family protein n=1 Tax=Sinorhizobium TaxID=28105 RepID=UPI00040925DB|nr:MULTISPECIES: caspase family protein [Sinorhizobium]WOS67039.1 caspase family protein [Sinorhizobium fredii GR64]
MGKPLFIAIAVHRPRYMPILPGVLEANDKICAWAARRNYDVVQIDDRNAPVTVNRIREHLTPDLEDGPDPSLLLDRDRIVVYFCGHGIAAWPDQYWILSPGPNQSRDRISANGFRDVLASYDPLQIAFISDACRSPGALSGTGDPVLDRLEGSSRNPQKDIFYSCREGTSSFAMPATASEPAYLIFSSVLMKALSAPDGANIDPLLAQLNRQAVTSQSLSDYLESNVPAAALGVDRQQAPQCDPGFRPLNHIYEEFTFPDSLDDDPDDDDPTFSDGGADLSLFEFDADDASDFSEGAFGQDGDEPSVFDDMAAYLRRQYRSREKERIERGQAERFELSRSEWRAPLVTLIGEELSKASPDRSSIAIVGSRRAHIIFQGQREAPSRRRLATDALGSSVDFFTVGKIGRRSSKTACLRYGDRSLSLVPIFRDMHVVTSVEDFEDEQGIEFLSWVSVYGDPREDRLLHSAEALKGLSQGYLRSADAKKIAGQIRYAKHLDPMMGIVAAYLYNAVGDIDNIRRMAYYYTTHSQPIPFDIAMLAGLELIRSEHGFSVEVPAVPRALEQDRGAPNFTQVATPNASGNVAGLAPVLRMGWPYLRESRHSFHKSCWRFIDHLASSPVTTFTSRSAVQYIAAAFRGDWS